MAVVGWVPWWLQVELPHSCTSGFTEAYEDDYPFFVGYSDGVLSEGDDAVGVAKYSHAEEIVDEGWHYVATGGSRW